MPRKATKPPAGTPATATSIRQLAMRLGKSHTAVAKWVKSDDRWPFGREGPWDVDQVKAWAERTLAPDPAAEAPARQPAAPDAGVGELGPERQAKLAISLERAATLRFNREVRAGQFHRVDECLARRVRQIQEAKNRLMGLADSLPCDEDLRAVIRARLMDVLTEFAGGPRQS